jgi:biotin synthase
LGINSTQTKEYSDEAFAAALTDEISQQQNASLYVDATAKISKPNADSKATKEKTKSQPEQSFS